MATLPQGATDVKYFLICLYLLNAEKEARTAGQSAKGKYILAVIDKDNLVVEADETNNQIVAGPIP